VEVGGGRDEGVNMGGYLLVAVHKDKIQNREKVANAKWNYLWSGTTH
jgi:hypothetical protein